MLCTEIVRVYCSSNIKHINVVYVCAGGGVDYSGWHALIGMFIGLKIRLDCRSVAMRFNSVG